MPQIDFMTYGSILFWNFFLVLFFFYIISEKFYLWFSSNFFIKASSLASFKFVSLSLRFPVFLIFEKILKIFN